MAYATITLELFKSGIHATCEDTGDDEFIPAGDGNKLIDFINEVDELTNPDATFTLTEKGKEYARRLREDSEE